MDRQNTCHLYRLFLQIRGIYYVKNQTMFELIHNIDTFTNDFIIQWNKMFNETLGFPHILTLGYLHENRKSLLHCLQKN